MSQVLHTMQLRLPAVDAALTELRLLMSQPDEGTQRDRLDKLCAGREPRAVVANLEAFQQAVQSAKGYEATGLWVKVAPTLKVVNG
ncbi:MAG TPA: hypothetical protein VNT01_12545 [Symbiobacteriaceae bacterium]|nr:hypothetical protein [Symbiobacteriaceae bacterium]